MASAERGQNPPWLSASLWTGDAPSCGLHQSEVIFLTRLVYVLWFLTQLCRAASLTAKCRCWVAEPPLSVPRDNGLCLCVTVCWRQVTFRWWQFFISLHPPHTPFLSFPLLLTNVQGHCTMLLVPLPSPGRLNVMMLWSVLLDGSAGIMSPTSSRASPRSESPPCLCVLHSCSFQEITIQEISSL